MNETHEFARAVDRRELLARAALTGAAASAYLYGLAPPRVALASGAFESLDASGRVTGVVATRDGFVAIGETADGGAAAWAFSTSETAWRQTADADGFPAGANLRQVTVHRGRLLAAGAVETVADGHDHAHGTMPAIFASRDARAWRTVLVGMAGVAGGTFSGIASHAGRVLAAGTRFAEADVAEGTGLVAVASRDGDRWSPVTLDAVTPPRHGSVTLLADVGREMVLGTNGFETTNLYAGAPGRAWRLLPAPAVAGPVTYVAAAATRGGYLLAGIDHLDGARYWRFDGARWREIKAPRWIGAGATVTDLERADGVLVAAGFTGGDAMVTRRGGTR